MAQSLPPLTWFRAFESAASHLNFTLAAEELGLTQSAVSQHVRSLEHRLGCLLFVRKHRGLALTDEGRRLLPGVSNGIGILKNTASSFDTNSKHEVLTIATSISIAQWYLVPRLKSFIAAHDSPVIRLITKVWPDEFLDSLADIDIRFDSPESAGKNTSLLGDNYMLVVGAPELASNIIAMGSKPEQIANSPLLQVVGTSDNWQSWAIKRNYCQELQFASFVESHAMAVDMARAGLGLAFTNAMIAGPSLLEGALVALESGLPECKIPARDGYHMSIRANDNSDLSKKFADWIVKEIDSVQKEFAINLIAH